MKTYFAIIDKEEDSAFGLWFPDVPGCFSAADDDGDIVKNAIEALGLHLDGMDLPPSRTSAELRKDADVAAALSAGGWMMAIPYINIADTKQVRANISMERGMLDAIDAAAKARGLTRSSFLTNAARKEIELGS